LISKINLIEKIMWIKKIKEKTGQLLIDFLGDNLY
jgi:hypothetical protein